MRSEKWFHAYWIRASLLIPVLALCLWPRQLCTVTGKSHAHFFSNFFVAPLGKGGQFWNWIKCVVLIQFENKCALLCVTLHVFHLKSYWRCLTPLSIDTTGLINRLFSLQMTESVYKNPKYTVCIHHDGGWKIFSHNGNWIDRLNIISLQQKPVI